MKLLEWFLDIGWTCSCEERVMLLVRGDYLLTLVTHTNDSDIEPSPLTVYLIQDTIGSLFEAFGVVSRH